MRALSSTKVGRFGWAGAALLFVALGCGGSTDGSGASGGSGNGGRSGGSGGSSGEGGSTTGGSGGSSGGEPDAGVVPDGGDLICGSVVCPPTTFGAPSCCTARSTCGFIAAGTCFDRPSFDGGGGGGMLPDAGVPDPTCPELMLGSFTLTGCCMSDDTCGYLSQLIGGCISHEQLRNLPGVNLPEGGPMACVYPPPTP